MIPIQRDDAVFLDKLKAIVGPGAWLEPEHAEKYLIDLRGQFQGHGALIIKPDSTQQVADIVTCCNANNTGIIPYGAGTGAVAGHLETEDRSAIILSLERMNQIRSVDISNDSMIAEAGCVLENIQQLAKSHNRRFGLSLASEGSCLIGGNLASNAGGIQVLRYGNARDMCLGIEAVMPDGSILSDLKPLRKNNTGYDLRHLLIGSEGTLGIITAAALKLSPLPDESVTVVAAIPSPDAALSLLHVIRAGLGETVSAFELMSRLGIELANRYFPNLPDPFDKPHAWYVIMEIEGHKNIRQQLETVLEQAMDQELLIDAVFGESSTQSQTLWQLRELAYEYNTREGVICSSDTAVPISQTGRFIDMATTEINKIDKAIRINAYGHVGDGNIHINIFPPEGVTKTDFLIENSEISERSRIAIDEITVKCGGSISAEHGIGRLKISDLQTYGDPVKLSLMRSIKQALDPLGIMNPGALL